MSMEHNACKNYYLQMTKSQLHVKQMCLTSIKINENVTNNKNDL